MALKESKRALRNPPKKAVGVCVGLILFIEIGDSEGSGRPGNMTHTHSLKWPHATFGPAFNAKATVSCAWYSETPPLEIHLHRQSYWACGITNGVILPDTALRNA